MSALDQRYQVPSRKHLVNTLLQEEATRVHSDVMQQLSCAESVCVTLDIWSSRQMRSYLGITGHFLVDWSMKSVVLACKRFRGRHTADSIGQQFEETIQEYNIASKISTIVTDNASNMVKAFSLPEFQPIAAHTGDSGDEDDDLDTTVTVPADIYDQVIADHSPCFCHTTQLVVVDGFKAAGQLNRVLGKVSKVVNHVHKSTIATDLLEGEVRLQTANATRWNSQVKMIRSVLAVPAALLDQLDAPTITAYDRNIMTDMLEILEPFEEATDIGQRDNTVTASYIIPTIIGLRIHLATMKSRYNCGMITALHTSLDKRMAVYEHNEVFRLASCLDPRFKLQWCRNSSQREAMIAELSAKAVEYASPAPTTEDTTATVSPVRKRSKLFDFMTAPVVVDQPTSVMVEVNQYLGEAPMSQESDPLAYWKGHTNIYPTLVQLAVKFLTVMASSASVERTFSIAGKVFRPDRCRLTDRNFETTMMIKCNDTTYKK